MRRITAPLLAQFFTTTSLEAADDMCGLTLLLASVETSVNLQHQLNDEMKQHKCSDDPSCPRRHKRLVQIQTDEDRRHYNRRRITYIMARNGN